MSATGFALVLLSALLHATWNFLLKRAGGGAVVVGLSKVAEAIVFAPIFIVAFLPGLPAVRTSATYAGVAAVGVAANYIALGQAYRHGDLSFVYPVSRGAILAILPVAGWLALGERLSVSGALALACIVGGIVVLNLSDFSRAAVGRLRAGLGSRASTWAITAAFFAALFTVWDKLAIRVLAPFAYMYLYTTVVAVGYAVWLARRHEPAAILTTWRESRVAIVAIGVLNTTSYLLVLLALREGVSSYVLGLRQLSIAAGVVLGWRYLREPTSRPRVVGVALIVVGCLALSFLLAHP